MDHVPDLERRITWAGEIAMEIELIRDDDPSNKHNYGKLFVDKLFFGETLEDKDRYLEFDGDKVDGDTAIPRGRYRVTLSPSQRFGRVMPEIHDVPDFTGVRIHGGNYAGLETKYVTINRDILKDVFSSVEYVDVYDDGEKG